MTDMEKRDLVDMEIRGLTIRSFRWLVGGIFGITGMGVVFYVTIMNAIFKLNLEKIDSDKRMDNLEQRQTYNSVDIRNIYQNVIPGQDKRISTIEGELKDDIKTKPNY